MPHAPAKLRLSNGDEMNTQIVNTAATDVASKTPKHPNLTWYAAILAGWQVKLMGAKPTADQLSTPLYWGYRAGSEALHLAMCLRPEGCTVQQFCTAGSCGPANNKRRDVVSHRKLATVTVSGTPYAYKLVMTAKGRDALKAGIAKVAAGEVEAKVKAKAPAKAAKAAKGKVNAKGRNVKAPKAKPAPVASPAAVNVPQVTVPVAPVDQHAAV